MVRLIERAFTVPLSVEEAWRVLGRVESWPTWAKHIRRIDVDPPGELTEQSTGYILLRNGLKTAFRMREYHPGRNWQWAGPLLWLTVYYDHRFEAAGSASTRLTWIVDAAGVGASVFGRLFAAVYSRNLDKAVPKFVAACSSSTSTPVHPVII